MSKFIISKESVDSMIEELDAEILESKISSDFDKYMDIHTALVNEVKSGNITLEFASEVDTAAREKYISTNTSSINKKKSSISLVAPIMAIITAIIGTIAILVRRNGLKNDPELISLKKQVEDLRTKITLESKELSRLQKNITRYIAEYNKMAKVYGSAMIKVESLYENDESFKSELANAEGSVTKMVQVKKSTSKQEQNINYNPEKALEIREKITKLTEQYEKFQTLEKTLNTQIKEVNKIIKRLNRFTLSKIHSEDKQEITKKISNINKKYSEALNSVNGYKDVYRDI